MLKYKIIYHNGFVQYCNLVTKLIYNTAIKPHEDKIHELECLKFKHKKNKDLVREISKEIKTEEILLSRFGNYFVEDSPLFFAIFTQRLITHYYNESIKIETI